MDTDKVILLLHTFGQAGNRQGGGVGAQHRIRVDHVFDFLEHLVLQLGVFEHGFNHKVHALQIFRIGGGGNAAEDLFFFLLSHFPLGDFLVE